MSKSKGNFIALDEDPSSMFSKIMSIPDSLINKYYTLLTDYNRSNSDPREAKLELGKIIVALYHAKKAAEKACEEFIRVVSEGGRPSEIPRHKAAETAYRLIDLLVEINLATSKSEARRLIEQGGVKINDIKKSDPNELIETRKEILVQVGKRNFIKVY